ncbi:hypothetical protein EG68_11736 [Paragonimus skrjabini miyazakii]|uniref:Serine aminopeptidase S33 domain-containing protein n=1 Tax=Paragonimus skrjabini miyazakii TaxID=59628 RepID=A0A8S9YAN3_9TREM|nr:hypothetical protein EG68_11736 [Paragonimus skrjabini miyazakii]
MIENSMVYARHEPPYSRLLCEIPENYNFMFWEHIELFPEGKNGPRITGFLIFNDDSARRSTCPTILVLHGNAGNVGHRLPMCRLLADNVQCNILLIDYRGFGRSSGTPSEPGLYSDAHAGLRYLLSRPDIAADKIFIFGRSIGGAVAIQLATNAADVPLRGVIIENSFTSLPEAAQHIFSASFGSLLRYVMPSWVFINKYPSLERLQSFGFACQETRAPKFLFLSGDADDLIPPKMMKSLANAYRQSVCREPSNPSFSEPISPSDFMKNGVDGLVTFCGGRHNDTWLCSHWGDVICHFIRQSCGSHFIRN